MDYLKKLYAQLRDLFLSMTPGNRIIATLLAAVLVVSLGYLFVGSIRTDSSPEGKYVYLYNGWHFDNSEQRAAEDALSQKGLRAHEWVGDQLRVPKSLAAKYTAELADKKVVNPRGVSRMATASGFSPWETSTAMEEKMKQASASDLADAIALLPDIATAKVIPNVRRDFNRKNLQFQRIPSVAVIVEAKTYKPLSDDAVASIAGIVATGFGIVDRKDITITDSKNTKTYNGLGQEMGGNGTSYMREQTRYQEIWKDKIYNLFPYIRGLQVETSIVLTQTINERVFTVQHGEPTAVHEHLRGTDFLKQEADRFGRPGQIAQMSRPLIDPTAGQAAQAKTTEKTHEKENSNALQGSEKNFELIPLVPQKIVASLQIPRSHVRKHWLDKNTKKGEAPPEPTDEQLDAESVMIRDDMKKQVEMLLFPYRDPKNPEVVQITEYPDMPEEEHVATAWETFQIWLFENWQTLGLMGLVLAGLGVLWLITRPSKPEPIVIYEAPEVPLELLEARAKAEAQAAAAATEEGETYVDEDGVVRTLEPFSKSIRSLQEEIAELVEENPDAAAAVLRQWIGTVVQAEK